MDTKTTPYPCNRGNMRKLIHALEGKIRRAADGLTYKQARRRLRIGDTFCCLGVACDLAAKDIGGTWARDDREYSSSYSEFLTPDKAGGQYRSSSLLPPAVAAWLGLPDDNGDIWVRNTGARHTATAMNDSGLPFTSIAAALRDKFGITD